MSPKLRALLFLLCAALIWGFSYPIGKLALKELTPWAYAGLRFMFGTFSLLPIVLRRRRQPAPTAYAGNDSPWLWLWGGSMGGICLSIGAIMQLTAMSQMQASEVGFITTLYVSLVPVLAFVIGYMPRLLIIIGLSIGLVGLFLLTGGVGSGSLNLKGAALVLAADVFWALQVIVTGRFAGRVNTWLFSLAQAMTSSILVLTLAFFTNKLPTWHVFLSTLPFTMWGILSVGVAYTCQTLAQRDISSTSAALIFPLQSVIGATAGVFLMGEIMTTKMVAGAAIIVCGTLVAQFARESAPVTVEHKHWKSILAARWAVGLMVGFGTVGAMVWGFS